MTTEKPILFNGDMVRAILFGKKTETRRPLKPQPSVRMVSEEPDRVWAELGSSRYWARIDEVPSFRSEEGWWRCPFGRAGGSLWVRETHAKMQQYPPNCSRWEILEDDMTTGYEYRADLSPDCTDFPGEWPRELADDPDCPKWTPSIHMPREACRLVLSGIEIRVERLSAITSSGIRAEGTDCPVHDFSSGFCVGPCAELRSEWARRWDNIYGKQEGLAWADDPWVWVVKWSEAQR